MTLTYLRPADSGRQAWDGLGRRFVRMVMIDYVFTAKAVFVFATDQHKLGTDFTNFSH